MPNYSQGEYEVVMSLVKQLEKKGKKYKQHLDDAIDRCKHLAHLREAILELKEVHDKETSTTKQSEIQRKAAGLLERYYVLLCYYIYLKENTDDFETPFSKWATEGEGKPYLAALGTADAGPLASFQWK